MKTFKASVQYDDLKGSVAADNADKGDARDFLKSGGHITDDEFIVGISMWAGENHGEHRDPVSVRFLVSDLKGHENVPEMIEASGEGIELREVHLNMNLVDFFALFKRLELTLSNGGRIEGISYTTE